MKTGRHIAVVLAALAAAGFAAVVAACAFLGLVPGLAWSAAAAAAGVIVYRRLLAPWHARWGATAQESARRLGGDSLVGGGSETTRAISIAAPCEAVWPWLVQIGFGRAGWYSYDWLDNDGEPSATEIIGRFQHLAPGDRIPMTPELGFVVESVAPPTEIVSLSDDGSTAWTLRLDPAEGGCRLISRFRAPAPHGVAAHVWAAIAGPGAFIMELRMLKGIRSRAERAPAPTGQ